MPNPKFKELNAIRDKIKSAQSIRTSNQKEKFGTCPNPGQDRTGLSAVLCTDLFTSELDPCKAI